MSAKFVSHDEIVKTIERYGPVIRALYRFGFRIGLCVRGLTRGYDVGRGHIE